MKEVSNKVCSRNDCKKSAVIVVVFTALLIALCFVCAAILSACQTTKDTEMQKLAYVYDEQNQGYIVTEVLKSDGGRVEIPKELNGKKVIGVSCEILVDSSVTEYNFCGSAFFTDTEKLATADIGSKKIFAERTAIDCIRAQLYKCAEDETIRDKALTLANGVVPSGLKEDERYITFNYDWQTYCSCSGNVLPVFICKNGDAFNTSEYLDFGYVKHCDKSSVSDMHWAYSYADGYILKDITVDGHSVTDGYILSENAVATVEFEKVYRIYVNGGNDENYDLTVAQPDFCYDNLNNERLPYRYVPESRAEDFLNGVKMRNGFALNWQYSAHIDGSTAEIKRFNSLSAALSAEKYDLDIYPVWSVNAFEVNIRSSAENYTVICGDEVTFYAETPDMDGVDLTYEWRHNGKIIGRESTLKLTCPTLSGAYDGVYAVSVGIADSEDCVVSAYSEASLNLLKRTVAINWSDCAIIYNGSEQAPSAEALGLFGEKLDLQVVGGGVNACEYVAQAKTDSADYDLKNATVSFAVSKAELIAKPCDCTTVYGNAPQPNGLQFFGFVGNDSESVISGTAVYSFTNTSKQVGKYVSCVRVSGLSADNYEISCAGGTLEIVQRQAELKWLGGDNLVYDSAAHYITATVCNKVADDDLSVAVSGGEAVNAGNYTAVATLCGVDSGNYLLKVNSTFVYSVEKAECPLKVFLADTVYGEACNPSVTGNLGNGIVECSYGTDGSCTLTVGSYTVTARVGETANYKAATAQSAFEIIPREVSLLWKNNTGLTYDASAKNVEAEVTGILLEDSVLVQVAGGNQVNAGNYNATTKLVGNDAFNYKLPQLCTCEYEIEKCAISIIAEDKCSAYSEELQHLTAVVNGTVYNGEVAYALSKEAGVNAGKYRIDVIVGQYENYDITTASATYSIIKATPKISEASDGKFEIEGYVAFGTDLGGLTNKLPLASISGSWLWKDGSNFKVEKVGKNSFIATFKPTDEQNYNEIVLSVILNVKRINDFFVTLGSEGEFSQFTGDGESLVIEWNGVISVIDYMISGSWGDEVQGELSILITCSDGSAPNAEWNGENIEILIFEEGIYNITFSCSGNDEYMSGSLTITVVVE